VPWPIPELTARMLLPVQDMTVSWSTVWTNL
jgi:hypothetical protein